MLLGRPYLEDDADIPVPVSRELLEIVTKSPQPPHPHTGTGD